jgi:hypothetical protein
MKTLLTIAIAGLLATTSVRAQWVVYDPIMNVEQILAQAENIAQYVQMVDNQVQQISQLSSQLQQLQQYNKAFGDPSVIVNVNGANALVSDLQQPVVGQNIATLEVRSDGAQALSYNGNGLYVQIGATFTTPSGNQIQRNTNYYRPYEGVNQATENYTNVNASVLQRRAALKAQIASTTDALQSATTASEVQKLTGVLIGQSAALAATDKEIDQAGTLSLVQDIENRVIVHHVADEFRMDAKADQIFCRVIVGPHDSPVLTSWGSGSSIDYPAGKVKIKLAFTDRDQHTLFSLHGLPVGPLSLTTTPVPLRKPCARHDLNSAEPHQRHASVCGRGAAVRSGWA